MKKQNKQNGKINRRRFIGIASAAAAYPVIPRIVRGSTFGLGLEKPDSAYASGRKNEVVAIQLYSVRNDMRKDPPGILKQIAGMGYTHVEHANYVNRKFYGYNAADFKKILDDLGLKMPGGHTVLGKQHWDEKTNDFTDSWKYTVEDAATCGQKYIVSPWLAEELRTYDPFMKFMEVFNKCGELCNQSGMKFGYHNHDFEFSLKLNGKDMFDLIMKNTDADKVCMQLDIGNMYIAGAKAIDIITRYPGRFENIHVKDMIKTEGDGQGYESTIIGKGVVDVKKVIDLTREKEGTWLYIIEQESYQGKTPMECIKSDLKIMKEWGYPKQ